MPARTSSLVLLIPGEIETRTGGYGYDREIVAGLRALGWTVDVRSVDRSFPFPSPSARAAAREVLASLPDGAVVLADGLAFGAMAEEASAEAARLTFMALVHHPLALESGLDADTARALFESEQRALATTRGVVVTSDATVASLAPYDVPASRIVVVPPGTASASIAAGSRARSAAAPVELLCVATLTPRKGHDVLFEALGRLSSLSWHLTCAGGDDLHPPTTRALHAQADRLGLAARISFPGSLDADALDASYDRADVFVLPTRHEGYGMAVAEAVARGLPVVGTPTGAIPALVNDSSGVIVPIDDVEALARALERLIADDTWRERLADGARRRRDALPTWREAATRMAAAVTRFAG